VAASATFVVGGPDITPVTPTSWASARTHGTAGEFKIALTPADGTAVSESRNNGIQKLIIVFDNTLTPGSNYTGSNIGITGAGLAVSSQTLATTNVSNDTLIVNLTGSVDRTCYTFNLTGVVTLAAAADPTCSVVTVVGDANNSKSTTATDMSLIKTKVITPPVLDNTSCRWDINVSGTFTATDTSLTKTKVVANSTVVPCP
jgi:hypothetical protein